MSSDAPYVDLSHPQITVVDSIEKLLREEFTEVSNVILYRRQKPLVGDFSALARAILSYQQTDYVEHIEELEAKAWSLRYLKTFNNAAILTAKDQILNDIESIAEKKPDGLLKQFDLRTINKYRFSEDIENFHSDSLSASPFGRLCISYNSSTQGVYDEDVEEYMPQGAVIKQGAKVFQFKAGDMWRHAGLETSGAKPFIHRAPPLEKDRMLLVMDWF